eukprot:3033448-Prymnesium_polylepis.1
MWETRCTQSDPDMHKDSSKIGPTPPPPRTPPAQPAIRWLAAHPFVAQSTACVVARASCCAPRHVAPWIGSTRWCP